MYQTWWRREVVRRFRAASNGLRAAPARRRPAPRLEALEDRLLLDAAVGWSGYAHDPQHTAISAVASQSLDLVRWQTPVDLNPQYSGGDLLIHYGSPLVTPSNTVIVPVKTGATSGFRLEGHNGGDGKLLWTQSTDYLLPPHNWTPSFSPALTPTNRLYYAGAGGTVYVIDNPDSPGSSSPTHLAFYGIENYNPSTFNNSVYINTPITADSNGTIYFGFEVVGSAPLNLHSGIARIDAAGNGTWIAANVAAGDSAISKVVHNNAPALSNDGSTLYVAVNTGSGTGFGVGYLLALDSTTLQPLAKVRLKDPRTGNDANLPDDGTASPTVGPDGDVYFGVLESPFATSKGWLLHFSGDLSQIKSPPGAFGWDDTVSIVASSLVPSYHGASTYLLMTKYNNYADTGGDGVNKIAILDPNDTEVDPRTHTTVMKEVISIAGVTPDPRFPTLPNAVREWCINTAVVDPFTDSVLANSEDGRLYRWDLTTNTFSQSITLTTATGEAYTPTLIGVDGTVYAINNATLFAVKRAAPAVIASTPSGDTVGTVGSVRVTFNEPINTSTFTLNSIDSFTRTVGPFTTDLHGALLGVAPVTGSGGRSFDITFTTQTALGEYRLVIGPNILDLAGNPMDQNGNGILGETPDDEYTAAFSIQGPKIIASTPSGNNHMPGELISSATVTFNEPINPATFMLSEVFAFHGPDGFHTIQSVSPVAGSNNTRFTITFAPVSTTGSYTLLIGPDIRDTFGHRMDQNGNFIEGEFPGDVYTLTFGIQGLKVVSATPNSNLPGLTYSLRVVFNEAVDPSSFTTGEFALTGPDGVHAAFGVVPVAGSNFTQFDVLFVPPTAAGSYTAVIGPNIRDVYGNAMDQDGNLVPGEDSDVFTTTFSIASPRVLSSSPTGTVEPAVDHVRLTFDRSMNGSSFSADHISLTGPSGSAIAVTASAVPFTNDTQFDVSFAPQAVAGNYTLVLDSVTDLYGNPLPAYTTGFTVAAFHVLSLSPSGSIPRNTDHLRVTFDRPVDPATFGVSQVTLTGPGGAVTVTSVAAVAGSTNTQFDVSFTPLGTLGAYTLTLSTDIKDIFGNALPAFTAMLTVALVSNGGFESGDFNGWTTTGSAAIKTSSFGTGPTEGTYDALITNDGGPDHTAVESFLGLSTNALQSLVSNVTNGSAIKQTITVSAGSTLTFDWNFLTSEFPGDTTFRDFGFVSITPVGGGGTLAKLADTTSSLVSAPSSTGFSNMTGFKTFSFTFSTAGTYVLGVGAMNAGDTTVNSGLLVDNFQIVEPPSGGGGQPQLAAAGAVAAGAKALTAAELAPVVQEAVALWASSGLTAAQVAQLQAVQFQIGTLADGVLGWTVLGSSVVTLDATASGFGWFVDPISADVTAFGTAVTPREFQAAPDSPAFGRMDLLTVVEHELGHVLGLNDLDPQAVPHDLLTTTLAPGVRRLPTPTDPPPATYVAPPPLVLPQGIRGDGSSDKGVEPAIALPPLVLQASATPLNSTPAEVTAEPPLSAAPAAVATPEVPPTPVVPVETPPRAAADGSLLVELAQPLSVASALPPPLPNNEAVAGSSIWAFLPLLLAQEREGFDSEAAVPTWDDHGQDGREVLFAQLGDQVGFLDLFGSELGEGRDWTP
jgi:hypothetical protein